ncbi:MAG: signal peptidase II [Candidatus Izemoplasma sp.]|nr:signal peptidase II [Candidatus Izemoplasma sp.]
MTKTTRIGLLVISILVALDQITKLLIKTQLYLGEEIPVIPQFFTITSHRNDGAAWGIFSGNMLFFYLITLIAGVLFYLLLKESDVTTKKFYSYGIFLMVAGGIGNFIDRLAYKQVVDFIDIDIFSYTTFPIFNIADICLVIGMIMFTLDVIIEEVFYGNHHRNTTK